MNEHQQVTYGCGQSLPSLPVPHPHIPPGVLPSAPSCPSAPHPAGLGTTQSKRGCFLSHGPEVYPTPHPPTPPHLPNPPPTSPYPPTPSAICMLSTAGPPGVLFTMKAQNILCLLKTPHKTKDLKGQGLYLMHIAVMYELAVALIQLSHHFWVT